jgi:hypothetical protein
LFTLGGLLPLTWFIVNGKRKPRPHTTESPQPSKKTYETMVAEMPSVKG